MDYTPVKAGDRFTKKQAELYNAMIDRQRRNNEMANAYAEKRKAKQEEAKILDGNDQRRENP